MLRRAFITSLGGAAIVFPVAARAQQREQMRRLAVLMSFAEGDPEAQSWIKALVQRLEQLGWKEDRNLRINYRWPGSDPSRVELFAKELIDLHPDLIVAAGTPSAKAVWQATRSVPVVLVQVADPVE